MSATDLSDNSRTTRVRSHYRPFSTLYSAPPYLEFPPDEEEKPSSSRLLKRASSIATMTLGIPFKPRRDPSTPPAPDSAKAKQRLPRRPSTATNDSSLHPPPSAFAPRLKTKRSMNAITTAPEATASSPSLGSVTPPFRPVLGPPPRPEDPRPSTASGRTVRFKERRLEAYSPSSSQTFKPRGHWQERNNMKYHPYGEDAVYMQAYDPIRLESERYSDQLLSRLSRGQPSFLDYSKQAPATVLDLGCGEGHWLIRAANVWKDSEITGFDIVDVTLPAIESLENVRFVQGNFLKYKLPFDDESFEFVRMSDLRLAVDHLSWVNLEEEVRRVMTWNGRLELIVDELMFPYANTPPVPKDRISFPYERRRLSYDTDEYTSDEDTDGDTLQGDESGSGESSTLYSSSRPSSFDESSTEDSPLPSSETARPLQSATPTRGTQLFRAPRYYARPARPVITDPYFTQRPDAVWEAKRERCQELERIFLSMLEDENEPYRVTLKPHDIMLSFLNYVFGEGNAQEKETFSVSLAEWNSPLDAAEEEAEAKEPALASLVDPSFSSKKKQWIKLEWEKRRQKKTKGAVDALGLSEAERAELTLESPIPEVVQPKAAKKLGLPEYTYTPSSSPEKTGSLAKNRKNKTPSPPLPLPFAPTPQQKIAGLSAKAAGRLGVSFTELTAAAAQATVAQRRGIKPRGMVQSPGLLVRSASASLAGQPPPSPEYVRVDAYELEMHACKWMHTLLGCRQALGQYVAKFVDEKGVRLVSEEMFGYYMSEYEGFNRHRFGWPTGTAEKDDPDVLIEPVQQSPAQPWNTAQSQPDRPIHVRTVRVYHATKMRMAGNGNGTGNGHGSPMAMLRVSSSYV